jgi:hypothetical protein
MWKIETPEQTPEQNAYAAILYTRIGEAVMLRRKEIKFDEWRPVENECHANATQIHLQDPSYTPVRGWLFFDFGGYLDRVQFLAHSVVRAPNGELWDITPSRASQDYPFIPAQESEEEFKALVEGGTIRLWHIK